MTHIYIEGCLEAVAVYIGVAILRGRPCGEGKGRNLGKGGALDFAERCHNQHIAASPISQVRGNKICIHQDSCRSEYGQAHERHEPMAIATMQ